MTLLFTSAKQCHNLEYWVSLLINRWYLEFEHCVGVYVCVLTLLGWACMDKAVLTERTLKRKGSCPWKVSLTLEPRQAGKCAIHWPSVVCAILLSLIWASPFGWAPIHSWRRQQRQHNVHVDSYFFCDGKVTGSKYSKQWNNRSVKPFGIP